MEHRITLHALDRFDAVRSGFRLAFALLVGSFFCQITSVAHAEKPTPDIAVEFLYGDHELFPSVIVSTTAYCKYLPQGDEYQLGDKQGVITVRIRSTTPNSKVRVTLAETPYFAESSTEQTLPEANEDYWIAPTIRYDHEKLASLKQPVANLVLKVTVVLNGETREFYPQIVLHSVNDWLVQYRPRGYNVWESNTKHLVAAFVNENSPLIDREITKDALKRGLVTEFRGYYAVDELGAVRIAEISAVYETLRAMGFRYTAVPQPSIRVNRSEVTTAAAAQLADPKQRMKVLSDDPSRVRTQYVRLAGDAMSSRQATGLEGAVLMASAYRKLGLHTVVMLFPSLIEGRTRTLIGVYAKSDLSEESLIVLDPELLGTTPFAGARQAGKVFFQKHRHKLLPAVTGENAAEFEEDGFLWIDLGTARANGVLPIPEFTP
jgi:hypothetical protein